MIDPRLQKLAEVIVNYSLGIKRGDKFMIQTSAIAEPLIREVFREAIRAGAHVTTRIGVEGLNEIALREASDEQLTYVSDLSKFELDYFDATLNILAQQNTKSLNGIDPKRMALAQSSSAPLMQRFWERTGSGELRWCITLFPTYAFAQDAGMSLTDYENFVFYGGLLDHDDPVASWRKVHDEQQHIVDFLSKHDEIHIVAPDTDITYRVGGRTWINANGQKNFPDGEVFTGPIENSVNGTVRYTYPAVYAGNQVEDVRLTFQDGKVIKSSAQRGDHFLNTMLEMDTGARYLGEVAFGLNYGIKQFTGNTLFDEKIGGTMHMALGFAIPGPGGENKSTLHWDMVCDLREGKVYADGNLCYADGKFTL